MTTISWLQTHRDTWQADLTLDGYRILTRVIGYLEGDRRPAGYETVAERAFRLRYVDPIDGWVGQRRSTP